MEKNYYPMYLAQSLLNDSNGFQRVQLLFSSDDLKPVPPKHQEQCQGDFVINAETAEQLDLGLCGLVNGQEHYWERQDDHNVANYTVKYRYGEVNKYDVRKFDFWIEERATGKTIAVQNSYQLLLGNMRKKDNRSWVGWGAAQGALSCALTEPSKFVLLAVAPND